jgi:hypothetical protein
MKLVMMAVAGDAIHRENKNINKYFIFSMMPSLDLLVVADVLLVAVTGFQQVATVSCSNEKTILLIKDYKNLDV